MDGGAVAPLALGLVQHVGQAVPDPDDVDGDPGGTRLVEEGDHLLGQHGVVPLAPATHPPEHPAALLPSHGLVARLRAGHVEPDDDRALGHHGLPPRRLLIGVVEGQSSRSQG